MNRKPFIMLVLGLALAGGSLSAQELVWQINYAKSNVLADVRLNGYPVYRPGDAGDNSGALMIGPWLRKGANELSITLTAKPADSSPDAVDPGDPSFSFSLFTFKRDDPDNSRNQLFRVKMPLKLGETIRLPWRMDFSIFLDQVPPSRLWDVTQRLDLNTELKSQARELMQQVFTALQKRDAEAYFQLFHWALLDMYTAYGWATTGFEEKVRTSLAEALKSADFQLAASDPDQLVYETVPGSGYRLIAVRGAGGKPAIDAGPFSQDTLFLAIIDGRLTIARN